MPPKTSKRRKALKNGVKKKKATKANVFTRPRHIVKREQPDDSKNEESALRNRPTRAREYKKTLIEIAQKLNIIKCDECNKRFRFKKSFKDHKLAEHSKLAGSVKCAQCHVRCPNKMALKEHIANVHERQIFKCTNCDKSFVRQAHVLRHMAQKGCDGVKAASYPCEICNAEFSRKDNLMVHLRLQHIQRKDFMCKRCPYSTRTFSKLIIHAQRYHSATKRMQYECDHCGKVTSSRAAICKHLEIHGTKKFACDVCGYSTFTIEVMRRHVFTHLDEKPYKCDDCDMSFIQRVQLQRHSQRYHTEKLVCKVCKKKFLSRVKMLAHAATHGQLTCPFDSCHLKKTKFSSEATLKRHINSHIEKRPFACEVCGKTYRAEGDMKRHVASHTLERARRCMYCIVARAYVRGEQLVRHVRKAHPDVFREHLAHVRSVLGQSVTMERVKKSELESILQVLDAEAERILEGYGEGVLYGGMQDDHSQDPAKNDESPLMSESELEMNLNKLLVQLIDKELLECFGWPIESIDTVLEKVIENCGAKAADRKKWTRVQRLRENTKHLFLYVIEDKNIARMLDSHTIDQIVKHILTQVSGDDNNAENIVYEDGVAQEVPIVNEFGTEDIANGNFPNIVHEINIVGDFGTENVIEVNMLNEFGNDDIGSEEYVVENGKSEDGENDSRSAEKEILSL